MVLVIFLSSSPSSFLPQPLQVSSFTIPTGIGTGTSSRHLIMPRHGIRAGDFNNYHHRSSSRMYSNLQNGDKSVTEEEEETINESRESTIATNGTNDSVPTETNANINENANANNNTKQKVWNTSIFPTKIQMSPAVEKDRFTPQLYVQTISAFVGIASGVCVSVFKLSIDAVRQFFYNGGDIFGDELLPLIPFFLIPIIGSIGVALISSTGEYSPGLRGVVQEVDNDSLMKDSNSNNDVSNRELFDNFLKPIRKSLAAIVTLGTGNSLGPEGPGVEIGTAVSRLGMLLWPNDLFNKFNGDNDSISKNNNDNGRISRNRLLLACGAAAGVSSGFNAPLSGVFFALEVVQASLQPINIPSAALPASDEKKGIGGSETYLEDESSVNYSDIELQQQSLTSDQGSITAILISSVLAALVARVLLGNELALELVTYEIRTPLVELPLYILLGLSCGLVSVVFSQAAKFFKSLFDGTIGPKPIRETFGALPAPSLPIIGGLTCGFVGYFYPQVLFFGYETLNRLLEDNTLPTELLLTLLAAKTLTTAVSAGSGLVGGK